MPATLSISEIARKAIRSIDAKQAKLRPRQFSRFREGVMAEAFIAILEAEGCPLKYPVLHLDSNAEFQLFCAKPYSETIAALLTKHKARTGSPGPNLIEAGAMWCMLNHFNAEALLRDLAA